MTAWVAGVQLRHDLRAYARPRDGVVIRKLAVLGASGDLTGRYLLPAVARLQEAGALPGGFRMVGVSRDDWDDEAFRAHAAQRLDTHAPDVPGAVRDELCRALRFVRGDVTEPAALRRVLDRPDEPAVVYLALPNTVFTPTLHALDEAGLPPGSRLAIEKPFGDGLRDARALNALIAEMLEEEAVFRVDHFLAKQTVLNVLGLRFANRVFEPVWNALHVERVDLVWDETLGLEGRAGYYDRAGALRDMLQNHLLQLLSLIAMEPPTGLDERALRDRKVDLLRAVRTPSREEAAATSRRARYAAGRVGDRELPAYADEPGVDPDRGTETYAELTLHVDNWRWSGVPFRLRTGKALAHDRREIVVRFRPVPHLPFADEAEPDVLRLSLDPDAIALAVNLNGAGDPFDLEREALAVDLANQDLPPYSRLLREILEGEAALSVRGDEAEEAWRIVEPVLDAWARDEVPLTEYPRGSAGPSRLPA